jgi:hypothetical protein
VTVVIRKGAFDEIAKTRAMQNGLKEAGEAVKDNVERLGIWVEHEPGDIRLPVEVSDDGSVTITHPAGLAVQAKHGALTKGAGEAGLEVGGR